MTNRQARGGSAPWAPDATPASRTDSPAPTLPELAAKVESAASTVEAIWKEYRIAEQAVNEILAKLNTAKLELAKAKKELDTASAKRGA